MSDIYVNLGNEFNRATVSFQNAGIDMAYVADIASRRFVLTSIRDLESTPHDLRNILERALGEEASITSLDRFLPRIREIIINLLQGLKRKQQIHRMQNGEAAAPQRMRRLGSASNPSAVGPPRAAEDARQRSISSTASRTPDRSPLLASTVIPPPVNPSVAGKKQLPVAPPVNLSPSQIQAPRKAPEPPAPVQFTGGYAMAPPLTNNDPVTQLSQMNLERRSSKRFSENYLAQLTSSPNGSAERHAKLSVDGVRRNIQKPTPNLETVEDQPEEEPYAAAKAYGSPPQSRKVLTKDIDGTPSLPSPVTNPVQSPRTSQLRSPTPIGHTIPEALLPATTTILFLRHEDVTKKASFEGDVTLPILTETIRNVFKVAIVPTLYIEDPVSKTAYELEDPKDIKQRSIISLQQVSTKQLVEEKKELVDDTSPDLRLWLEEKLRLLTDEIGSIKQALPSRQVDPAEPSKRQTINPASNNADDSSGVKPKTMDIPEAKEHEDTKSTAAVNKELSQKVAALEETNSALLAKITGLQNLTVSKPPAEEPTAVIVSANRDHVMSLSAKHEHRGTELTARLEEAMNSMDRIKKDVLQRKVSPRPQQLIDLAKEFEDIQAEADALAESLLALDDTSKTLWEEELLIITAEQDALEYQHAFIEDIRADVKDSIGNLDTIKKVEEQKRLAPTNGQPVLLDTTADPNKAIKFVQADIKSLSVNHEKRAAAIADAERLRLKEREYLLENEFKNELGAFVGSSSLKSTGGAAEIDRLRQEKDEEHRKLLFSPPPPAATPIVVISPTTGPETSPETPAAAAIPSTSGDRGPEDSGTVRRPSTPSNRVSGSAAILAMIDARVGPAGAGLDVHRKSISPRKRLDRSSDVSPRLPPPIRHSSSDSVTDA